MHVWKIQVNKNRFLTSQNTKQRHISRITHKYKSMSSDTRNKYHKVPPPIMYSPKTIQQEPKMVSTQ